MEALQQRQQLEARVEQQMEQLFLPPLLWRCSHRRVQLLEQE